MAEVLRPARHLRIGWCAVLLGLVSLPVWAEQPTAEQGATQAAPPAASTSDQVREEIQRLRREFETLRESYGARLAALELKVAGINPASAVAGQPTPAAAPPEPAVAPPTQAPEVISVPQGAGGAAGPERALPAYGSASASTVFNPDIAVIGNFLGAVGDNSVNPSPAFRMNEAEVTFQAVVDPYARADFFFSFSPEGVEIEEGYLTFTALPGGVLAKVGKLKEQIGKVNTLHPHSLPWVDRPAALTNLLGGEEGVSDSGLAVSKLIVNPLFFLEATGAVYQGSAGPFASHQRRDVSWVGRLRGYRDVTEATNLDVGGSWAYGHNDAGLDTTTRLFSLDATFRYRPLRRAIYRRFLARTEMFWSRRGQEVGDVSAFGTYASADYQFARRWFTGARYDWSERAADASLADKGPSLVLTFWPSEFSQVRGQYRRLRYAEGPVANEILFQFLFAIGAHAAHVF